MGKYFRKTDRGSWKEEDLKNAILAVTEEKESIRAAAKMYRIPERTLRRRLVSRNDRKISLGPQPQLGREVEEKLAAHIIKLQKSGFPLVRKSVLRLAYQIAERLNIKTTFNPIKKKAGKDWFCNFMRRNPRLSIRKAQGLSRDRAERLNREETADYFELLKKTLQEHNLMNKPGHIFNMDETGLQLNGNPGEVIAEKGSKDVSQVTSAERGETITVVGCLNAEGMYLPPYCIMKGKNKKKEWEDGMPPGSTVRMNQKSGYINGELFMDWLKTHFVPRKPMGKVLLILDGHASHTDQYDMVNFAEINDVVLLCLPSHGTKWLQPCDRAVYKSLKSNWTDECNMFETRYPGRQIKRLQFGDLLRRAWQRSATVSNAVSAFRSTGIYPYDPLAIPDYAYLTCNPLNRRDVSSSSTFSAAPISTPGSPSSSFIRPLSSSTPTMPASTSVEKPTPTKTLNEIHPLPTLEEKKAVREKQHAFVVSVKSLAEKHEIKVRMLNEFP